MTILTEPSVTVLIGRTLTLTCTFEGDPQSVTWYRSNSSSTPLSEATLVGSRSAEQILRPLCPKYDITVNNELVIASADTFDDAIFTCYVDFEEGVFGSNTTTVNVIGKL